MALHTAGTNANTSLSAFLVGTNDTIAADVATMLTQLFGDPPGWGAYNQVSSSGTVTGTGTNRPRLNQVYSQTGLLFVPNRGTLQLKAGDYVIWDTTTGWPLVLSGDAAANGPWHIV